MYLCLSAHLISLKDTDLNGQRRTVIETERSWDTLGGIAMGWTAELRY
jgi:hypothetical protein